MFIFACLITAFIPLVAQGYIRVMSMPVALVVLIVAWIIILGYSLKIYFMLKKNRKVFFFQFKVRF